MLTAVLLALSSPGLDAFDDANLALTACGFAAHREAQAANRGLADFKANLGRRCAGEIARIRAAIIAVETKRGKGRAAAQASADRTVADFHRSFTNGYATRHEDQAKLRALIDVLKKEKGSDAQ